MHVTTTILSFLILLAASASVQGNDRSTIRSSTMVRDLELVRGGTTKNPVKRRFDTVVLENKYLELTLCPTLGERITQVRDKLTGRKLLYEGVLKYSGSALTEGGGAGGGIHINHPYYHAGSSYVVPLPYKAAVEEDGTATLTLAYTAYPHLQRTVWRVSLRPEEAGFRSDYRFENLAPYSMGFNPWINAAFPLRKDIQFILPADWVAGHWFGINAEKRFGNWLRPWPIGADGEDQSRILTAQQSSVFGYGVTEGYSAIYFHDANDGLARVFDPAVMPGAKAAGIWKAPPQDWNWCEIWGAFSHNMEDPLWIGPHEVLRASDFWFPIRGIGGMTWANEQGAVNLQKNAAELTCGVYVPRHFPHAAVRLIADGHVLIQTAGELRPGKPLLRKVQCPVDTDDVRLTVVDSAGRLILTRQKFFSERPRKIYELPEQPWHRKTPTTRALWEEAFTPMMAWGPWYHPPTSYSKVLSTDANNQEARIGLARSLIKESAGDLFRGRKVSPDQQREKAAAILTELTRPKKADPRALKLLGLLKMQQGDNTGAAAILRRLVGTPSEGELAHYLLALLAASQDDWKTCRKHAQTAVELAPDSTLSRLLVAEASLQTGQPENVASTLAPLLEANPLEVAALILANRAATRLQHTDEVKRLQAALDLIAKQAPGQYQAGLAQVTSLEQGKDLDCLTIDTIRGSINMPGRQP
jgi:tetratricopeptide (TPR) repeat protein